MTVVKGDTQSIFIAGWWVTAPAPGLLPIGLAVRQLTVSLAVSQPRITVTVRGALP